MIDAWDLTTGPAGPGQLAALRSAIAAFEWHKQRGKEVSIERVGRRYVVRTKTSYEEFSYLSLKGVQ